MTQLESDNASVRNAWNHNAAFWDERMADGNDFFNVLLWPAVERLLVPSAGERLLDIACGNGVTSRRLANARFSRNGAHSLRRQALWRRHYDLAGRRDSFLRHFPCPQR